MLKRFYFLTLVIGVVMGLSLGFVFSHKTQILAQNSEKETISQEEVDKKLDEILESQEELKKRLETITTQTQFLKAASGK